MPSKNIYQGIPYSYLYDNGTMVNVGVPVLFDEEDFVGGNATNSVWYASFHQIFSSEKGFDVGDNVTLVGNYVNNIEPISSGSPSETYGLAKCEAYGNGKKCESCLTCAKSVSPNQTWSVSDKTGAFFDCSTEMDYCVGSTGNGLNSDNIDQCQEFTAPGFGACFETYTPPPPSASTVVSTSYVLLMVCTAAIVWML
jgi:hypothetical protein